VSFSDGINSGKNLGNSTGVPYFLFAGLSERVGDLKVNAYATLSVSQASLPGGCGNMDPEDPRCGKLTLIGEVEVFDDKDKFGINALISKHPAMKSWTMGSHDFKVYRMTNLKRVVFLNNFGGAHHLDPKEFLKLHLSSVESEEEQELEENADTTHSTEIKISQVE
jgi:hypothetical protein